MGNTPHTTSGQSFFPPFSTGCIDMRLLVCKRLDCLNRNRLSIEREGLQEKTLFFMQLMVINVVQQVDGNMTIPESGILQECRETQPALVQDLNQQFQGKTMSMTRLNSLLELYPRSLDTSALQQADPFCNS